MTLWTRILNWYDGHGRELPWRRTRDPYRILVSEIMLQQTQVSRGLIFYDRWLAQFPDWNTLAEASNADVIRAWAGLGYNRRPLMLRDIARQIIDRGVPASEEDWQTLKGIGPYTAAAIAAFALHQRTIPVDTNIRRVLGRLLFGIPYSQPDVDDRIRKSIDRILPSRGRFYDVPQALFDLAAMHCAKVPNCADCPMRQVCPASTKFTSGRVRVPKQMIRKPLESRHRNKRYPDRIYRGRILKLVRDNERVLIASIGQMIDVSYDCARDYEWILAMAGRLKRDGMIRINKETIRLAK